jgi:lipopolysaccharide/colanic/teichoic acid biosynthesis glycosyltransferase
MLRVKCASRHLLCCAVGFAGVREADVFWQGGNMSDSVSRRTPEKGLQFEGVLSKTDFLAMLNRERARVSRNSHCFALAVFSYPAGNKAGSIAGDARFMRLLLSKVRVTDAIGFLGKDEVGVFLAETGRRGADVFVRRVCESCTKWGANPAHDVWCHPEEPAGGGGDPRQMDLRLTADSAGKGNPEASGRRAGGMERYMAKPLPAWKRSFDIAVAVAGLIFFAPVMLLVVLLIKATSPGPVLFRQERIGYFGRRFMCLKFRTMHIDCDQAAHRTHLHDLIKSGRAMVKLEAGRDNRIIPFGKTIRLSGLDELPQLINVLRGDMSFVGPRPCIPYEYNEFDPWHRMRTEALPGLTGLWQVSGKNKTTFTEMIRYDIAYARRASLWLDVWIVLRTVPALAAQFRG